MMQPDVADAAESSQPRSTQRIIVLASGLLVMFIAFGFGSWFSGAASWIGFYLGARGQALIAVSQVSACIGFAAAVVLALAWYRRRCRHGVTEDSIPIVLAACLFLPIGNILWAIFVDAIAWHYGEDIVRPAFDYAIMYLILGGLLPLTIGVPWAMSRMRRRHVTRPGVASSDVETNGSTIPQP